jgi:BolA protein|tara:strand:- start:931 stop:1245 length:315 start_codon:yes stop_codon:yes gene_type:complete
MKTIENTIKNILIDNFDPSLLSVTNESFMHNVPDGSESHFKVVIVTDNFKDLNELQRHKAIYKALQDPMKSIHALSIYAFSEKQYQKNPQVIDSPNCAKKKNES